MTSIAVNAIHSGLQMDGHWSGTPSLMVQLMDHPAAQGPSLLDAAYPIAEWDYEQPNEIAITKLLSRRNGATSPHFSLVGSGALAEIIHSFRERHVVLFCRDPARWELAPLIALLRSAGRTIQVLTTVMSDSWEPRVWVSLVAMPNRQPAGNPEPCPQCPSEILACIRWRSDLDRAEALYSRMGMVWLRPSALAEDGIYRQCIAVATRHLGWRVTRKPSP